MNLPVSKLGPDGATYEGEDPIEAFDWVETPRDVVHPASPIRYRLEARVFESELYVHGHAEALFEGVCCRCGGPLSKVYGDTVEFSREISSETTEVDLTDELRETILLALPNNPVCSPDCKGLCPRCGKRLAEGPCGCTDSFAESAWGALDNLFGGESPTKNKKKKPE